MTSAPAPLISRRRGFSLVWVVPGVALAVGGWMIARELSSRGPEISIDFADGAGVEAGKTVVEHKGVVVGMVTSVELRKDLAGVTLRARLDKDAAGLAREGSQFWIVHPEIGFSGVRGLDTLVKGVRLNVRPGQGAASAHFAGLEQMPRPDNSSLGRAFVLQSDRLSSITPDAPVFYRDVKVGVVETSALAPDAASVVVHIRVFNDYADLVRTNSQFWNAGGLSLKVSLLGGAEIKNNTLESIFNGAVGFATPDGPALAPAAAEGATFKLNAEADKDWLKWRPSIAIKASESNAGTESPQPPFPLARDGFLPSGSPAK